MHLQDTLKVYFFFLILSYVLYIAMFSFFWFSFQVCNCEVKVEAAVF